MTQVVNEPTKESTQLDHIFTNKEELVGELRARGSLGCSDHEMVKSRILQEGNKAKRRFTTSDFRRTGFHLLMDLLGRVTWNMALERRGYQKSCLIFKVVLFQIP